MNNQSLETDTTLPSVGVNEEKIRYYQLKLEKMWNKTLEGIFEIGDLLNKAKIELKDEETDDYQILLSRLSFSNKSRAAERISAIAADQRFRDKSVQKLLPPCWTTLDVLQRLSDSKLKRACKNGKIYSGMRRIDAEELVLGSAKNRKAIKGKNVSVAGAVCLSSLTISDQNADNFESQKALLDVYFLSDLISNIFESHPDKPEINVQRNGKKPSKKLLSSNEVLLKLIGEARKIENKNRVASGKAPLNKIQEILSLLGVNPDNLGKHGFSLMERLAISYAKRNGIDCVDEAQLKWFAENARTEPKLLGSFLQDVQRQAARLISKKQTKNANTKIYEVDSEVDESRL